MKKQMMIFLSLCWIWCSNIACYTILLLWIAFNYFGSVGDLFEPTIHVVPLVLQE